MLSMSKIDLHSLSFINNVLLFGMWKIETDPIAKLFLFNKVLKKEGITKINSIEIRKIKHNPLEQTSHDFVIIINNIILTVANGNGPLLRTRTLEQILDILYSIGLCNATSKEWRKKIKNLKVNETLSVPVLTQPKNLFELDVFDYLTSWIGSRNFKQTHLASTLLTLALYFVAKQNNELEYLNFKIITKNKKQKLLNDPDLIKGFTSTMSQLKFNRHKDEIIKALKFVIEFEFVEKVSHEEIFRLIGSYRSKARDTIILQDRIGKNDCLHPAEFSNIPIELCDAAHIKSVSKLKMEIITQLELGMKMSDQMVQKNLKLINDSSNLLLLPHPIHYFFDLGIYELHENKLVLVEEKFAEAVSTFNLPKEILVQRH